MYQNAYRAMSPPLNPFEFIQQQTAPGGGSNETTTDRRKKDETVEVGELKQRVEELESMVARLGARTTEPKRKRDSRKAR
jgi:uncharacterized small protein (DUF1192 family)